MAALVVSACGSSSGASASKNAKDVPLVIVLNSTPNGGNLALLMAIDRMKKEGYNFTAKQVSGADVAAQAMASGNAQFNTDNITGAADAIDKGAPMKIVAANKGNDAAWVTKPGYEDCNKLNGKPVGIFGPAASSGYTKEMGLYFAKHCPNVKPKYITIPDSSLRAQALANGQLDATVLALADTVTLQTKLDPNTKYTITPFSEELPGLADNYIYTTDELLKDHPDAVAAFVKAQLEATRQIYQDPSAVPGLVQKYLGDNTYTKSVQAAVQTKLWYANGGLDARGIAGLEQTLKLFDLPGKSKDLVDMGPLDTVLKQIKKSPLTPR